MVKVSIIDNHFLVSFSNVNRLNSDISNQIIDNFEKLVKYSGTQIIFNLKGIKFIDSVGFDAFLQLIETADTNDSTVSFNNVEQDVVELIELLQLDDVFEIIAAA